MRFLIIILASLTFMASCREKSVSMQELQEYVTDPDNGLKKSVESKGMLVDVVYRPTDLVIAQQILSFNSDTSLVSELRKRYSKYHYFILSFSKGGKEALHQQGDQNVYSNLLQTLAFRMDQYAGLTGGGDTLDVADFQMDRTFGTAQATNLIVAFEKSPVTRENDIRFHLKEFGLGIGNHVFDFKAKDINASPCINFRR